MEVERAREGVAGGDGDGGKENARKPRGPREKEGNDDREEGRRPRTGRRRGEGELMTSESGRETGKVPPAEWLGAKYR